MISPKGQSLLTGRNNVTSLSSLSTIDMERMRLDRILDSTFYSIGLVRNRKYRVVDLIRILQAQNIKILSLDNNIFPEHFNPDMKELLTTDFRKKFFVNVLSESKNDEEYFKRIMDILEDEYVLTSIEIKTERQFDNNLGVVSIKAKSPEEGDLPFVSDKKLLVLSFNY